MLNNPHRFTTVASGCSVGGPQGALLMHVQGMYFYRDIKVGDVPVSISSGRCRTFSTAHPRLPS